jgi:arylsulfatase A-like enzyme
METCYISLLPGMVDKLDESVGFVVEALGKAGMLENSIIVFTSDNGGSPEGFGLNYGSNWPLRGVSVETHFLCLVTTQVLQL